MEKKNNSIKQKETRQYVGKKNSDIVNFPVDLRLEALSLSQNSHLVNAPITSFRILFKILNDISNDQFQADKQKERLKLFEDDFMTENNTYARFTFSVSEIDKSNNYTAIKKGLDFLEDLNRGWHKAVNSKGKVIQSKGGLISNPCISEGKITFLMSSFWIEKILKIPKYNQTYFKTPWALSKSRQVLFYLWLLEIPEKGTKIDFKRFQGNYRYNYKNAQELAKNVLKSLRAKLDRCSNVSFNYSTKGDIISIIPYYTNEVDLDLTSKTISKQRITQKLHYWKIRHNLTSNDINVFRSIINIDAQTFRLFEKSYYEFIKSCKKKKVKPTEYVGKKFLEIFQEEIKSVYQKSFWSDISRNGYPVIHN